MSGYTDNWRDHVSRATTTVHTDTPSAKVTWRNADGKRFRAIIRQKPNPIGFHAKLPGDAR